MRPARPTRSPLMPVSSESTTVETFPVTDLDVVFSSGQKYGTTLRDGVDAITRTDEGWVLLFADPAERVELAHAHIAMVAFRHRLQKRRVPAPAPAPEPA